MTISRVSPDQWQALQTFCQATFTETFGQDNSPAELEAYFATAYSEEQLRSELLHPQSATYVLTVDGNWAGYLKLNWGSAQTEQELDKGFEIQRIYLLKAYQGQGLGQALFNFALEQADQSGQDWVWLGVWEHNHKAQVFYERYGFEKFSEHRFPVGDKIDTDWLMKRRITK
ncbi:MULTISPECIES: GNAT family N-acetyltransferase [unclassified Streptococcus]|uniref:GNAT family N-acetyltransferase n=1 Tax=unclassified Streptococcus TaxID=2608887 RepID=UPI00359E718A